MIRWTTVPTPPDGYQLRDAEEFLALTAAGWTSGRRLGWTIDAQRDGGPGFCGSINLHLEGDGVAEFGFWPASSGARSLHHDCGVAVGLRLRIRRRRAPAHSVARWLATGRRDVSRRRSAWSSMVLSGVCWCSEASCATVGSPHWSETIPGCRNLAAAALAARRSRCKALVSDCGPSAAPMSTASSKPAPTRARHIGSSRCRGRIERHNALAYFESIGELAARCAGMAWCIADPRDDRCLGSVSLDGLRWLRQARNHWATASWPTSSATPARSALALWRRPQRTPSGLRHVVGKSAGDIAGERHRHELSGCNPCRRDGGIRPSGDRGRHRCRPRQDAECRAVAHLRESASSRCWRSTLRPDGYGSPPTTPKLRTGPTYISWLWAPCPVPAAPLT
mgnify:CR=1 FL=1